MKGATATLTAVLLALIVVAAAGTFFAYFGGLSSKITTRTEEQLPEMDVPPKLVSLMCHDGYGYALLAPSQGRDELTGKVYYSVQQDGDPVREGFLNLSLQGPEKTYLPVPFDLQERYLLVLSARNWEIAEYCSTINDPALVLHLPFDGGSGSTATDTSDYENHGSITEAAWTTGYDGGALEFDGLNDSVRVPGSDELNVTDEVTVASWVYQKGNATSQYQRITDKNGAMAHWLDQTDGGVAVRLTASRSGAYFQVNFETGLQQGTWHHLAFTYDSAAADRLNLYVDGEPFGSSNYYYGPMETNAEDLVVGDRNVGARPWNGTIDDVRVYSRALEAAEIAALHQAYAGGDT